MNSSRALQVNLPREGGSSRRAELLYTFQVETRAAGLCLFMVYN